MSYFQANRNVELSLLKYITDCVATDWSGITVVKTFKQVYSKDINLPVICVRLSDINSTRLEIGSNTLDDRYLLIIDIFTDSDGFRLDLSGYLKDKLKDGWVHYDHSKASGNNTALVLTANGRDTVTDWINDMKVDFGDTVEERDRYRHTISIRVRKSS